MPDEQSKTEVAPPNWSRYDRVKQILTDAAGTVHPSYQGHDQFWNLPHREFLEVKLYGIPMIAPVAAAPGSDALSVKSCCHGPSETAASAVGQTGRGAASGLIIGLKGQPPFDGSQFPPLPWGGTRVAFADIAFIEKWIDDGCPEHDARPGAADHKAKLHALATGSAAHALHRGPANAFRDQTGTARIRKNIDFLTDDELQRFRNAVAQMKALDEFEQDERSFGYWARIHANQCQHSWEQFLTWHRAYLYFFEQRLLDIDPTVTLPYWDWASYRANVDASIADMGSTPAYENGVLPPAYQCWIDQPGIDALKALGVPAPVLDKLATVINRKFDSGHGLFETAGIKWSDDPQSDQAIIDRLGKINPLWHYQRWPGGNSSIIFEAYPRPEDVDRILQLDNFYSFGSGPPDNHFFGALENIHNLIHNFSGGVNPNYGDSTEPMNTKNPAYGDMVNAGRTAFDPIFWGHHANCDRIWSEWQKLHPVGGPDDPDDILPPWPMTVEETYSTAKLGYEYMQSSYVFPTSSQTAITKFVSEPAAVHPVIAATHKCAQVRLHKVQYATRSGFFIRVFLNQADANADTQTQGNPHYVGMLNMFTGLCIGGPGHCAPPPTVPRRKFDQRSRAHKTPGNFRIDATGTVAALRKLGDTDFHVTLVVLNIDGTPATDALHLDGVSLNFFD